MLEAEILAGLSVGKADGGDLRFCTTTHSCKIVAFDTIFFIYCVRSASKNVLHRWTWLEGTTRHVMDHPVFLHLYYDALQSILNSVQTRRFQSARSWIVGSVKRSTKLPL
jgi:hypothetical protein